MYPWPCDRKAGVREARKGSLSLSLLPALSLFLALLRVCGGVLPERTPDGGREAVLTIANGQPWLTSSNVASGKLTWSISIKKNKKKLKEFPASVFITRVN